MSERSSVPTVECTVVPMRATVTTVYRLEPIAPDDDYYRERTDRHIGWITRREQSALREMAVGVAGVGGMGGLVAERLLRLGIGELRIADTEVFDVSNIGRQYGARRDSIGKNKALATAAELRRITDDSRIVVYPMGIRDETVDMFLDGLSLALDLVEVFAVYSRLLLHAHARSAGITVLSADAVGCSTNVFRFTPDSVSAERWLDMTLEEACVLEAHVLARTATEEERGKLTEKARRAFAPHLPEYRPDEAGGADHSAVLGRLTAEGRASILAPTPMMAAGVLANRVLIELLERISPGRRVFTEVPERGCLMFDAWTWKTLLQEERW